MINKKLGSYKDHEMALTDPNKVKPEIAERANRLATAAIDVQWVEGDAKSAESSFFKINQKASPIDATELKILKRRRTPVGIAARAIVRSGKGHKYWAAFSQDRQDKLEQLAQEVNSLLFHPNFPVGPIKSLDLPVGGPAYAAQSLPLVLDFIELVNNANSSDLDEDDPDGLKTLEYIGRCKKIAELIDSNEPQSLGLHPIVYFYSSNGRHKIASFMAVTALMIDLGRTNSFKKFTEVRGNFEELLIQYDYLVQQIVRQRRSATASVALVKDFYMDCIDSLHAGKSVPDAIDVLMKDSRFERLILLPDAEQSASTDFSRSTKSSAFIRQALLSAMKCPVCSGYVHRNGFTVDHIIAKEDGGTGAIDNAQVLHPYCNSGYKESLRAKKR